MVQENFLWGVPVPGVDGLLSAGDTAVKLMNFFINLLSDPAKYIPYLFTMVFGLLFAGWMLCVHTIWSLPVLFDILFWVYFILVTLILEILISVVFITLFAVLVCIDTILWLMDLLTFGAIRYLTRCEETPDAWYKRGNFVYDNITRAIFLCQYPCGTRFRPSKYGGMVCVKSKPTETPYCPQSMIYRLYKGDDVVKPAIMNDFTPDLEFWSKSTRERKDAVGAFFQKRQTFLGDCCKKMQPYQGVLKNICANWDTIPLQDDTPYNRQLLKSLCCQSFCQGPIGKTADFCPKMGCQTMAISGGSDSTIEGIGDVSQKIFNIIVMIVVMTIVVMMFLYRKKTR